MRYIIAFYLATVLTAPAYAESEAQRFCECTDDDVCWTIYQVCLSPDQICATSADCAAGKICDLSFADERVTGVCETPRRACERDVDCALGELCAMAPNPPTCAPEDAECSAKVLPSCTQPRLCDDEVGCRADEACVQNRCTERSYIAQVEAVEIDPARQAGYRDWLQMDDDDAHCAARPGSGGAGWWALMLLAIAAPRRRSPR